MAHNAEKSSRLKYIYISISLIIVFSRQETSCMALSLQAIPLHLQLQEPSLEKT